MKLKNVNLLLIALAAAFLFFSAGFCVGRQQTGRGIRVITKQPAAEASSSTEESTTTQPSAKLNLNTATVEELVALPGIGEVLAERIVAYRELHGSFSSIDELSQVEGIGENRVEAIRDYVTLGGTE